MPSHHVRVDRTRYIPSDFARVNPSTSNIAATTMLKLALGNNVYPTFQQALTASTNAIGQAGGQVLPSAPVSTNDVRFKAAIALCLLAIMTPVNSGMRTKAIDRAKKYIEAEEFFTSSDAETVQALSRDAAQVLSNYTADALLTPGVQSAEVDRWRKYTQALFGNLYTIEMIDRKKKQELEQIGISGAAAEAIYSMQDDASKAASSEIVTSVLQKLGIVEEPGLISDENPFIEYWNSGTTPKILVVSSVLALTVGTAFTIRHFVKKK